MEILTQVTNAGLLVSLKGALDIHSNETVRQQLSIVFQRNTRFLLLDFSGVTEASPAGLRNLLPYVQQIQEQRKELVIFNLKDNIQELITTSGFDSLVTMVDSLETAIKYVNKRNLTKK
ncbi:STAS domain-containing protein [Rufibacter tibetensis]|uniref:STAS domain-containing protein n=1 Tax=Rufibacter tibetensis TaxID=512763 RepID=A0A0P0CZK2_9BACT|nr:STAS domain-containing protein [Rufibacter tibetensis]ALI99965.1 hypothetical protein DC20_14525 [Rufibacter tibetensis]